MAFEGPAGCGKTYRLMHELAAALNERPLQSHQRVLALTFMHGSRRRLDDRLRRVNDLGGRYEAATIDSFAWRVVQRWRTLAVSLGHAIPREGEFGETTALAARLLEKPSVAAWVGMSVPMVVVDEAQDLNRARSAMLSAQASSSAMLLAFDEFQCLDPALLPIAIRDWLPNHCNPTTLTGCHRTSQNNLIDAARAVRDGRTLETDTPRFKIYATPGVNQAAAFLANAIAWRTGGGSVAVLTHRERGATRIKLLRVSSKVPSGAMETEVIPSHGNTMTGRSSTTRGHCSGSPTAVASTTPSRYSVRTGTCPPSTPCGIGFCVAGAHWASPRCHWSTWNVSWVACSPLVAITFARRSRTTSP